MAVPKKVLKLVQARDDACWHCGAEDDLVPHHRINRGMGGSKLLDTPDNLMMICSRWNGDMESDAELAATARGWGHKLPAWESLEHPVFDRLGGWWYLLPDGGRVESHWKDQAF
jgi:5-methylcytosine-specific restriction endonuclease McrA